MSSASSGRYQSRLFNFVRKQSRRFTQQRDRAFRHLQVSASWVAVVGLYPLLLIFQSTRSAAKQMHQAVQQRFPQLAAPDLNAQSLTPPTVDQPIQQVLLLVEALSSEEVISTPPPAKPKTLKNILAFLASSALTRFATLGQFKSGDRRQQGELGKLGKLGEQRSKGAKEQRRILPTTYRLPPTIPPLTTPRPIIQGIATQLSSRTLVLVTAQNETLDILTAQQQQTLQQQMIAAIADYWRYQRLARSIRSSEVKVLGNEFPTEDTRSILSPQSSLVRKPRITDPLLAFLDRTIAELESNHWEPVSAVAVDLSQRSRQLIQQLQTQFNFALSKGKSPAIAPDVGSEAYTTRMQTLIRAAIDYFFGHRGRQHLGQNMPKSAPSQNRLSQNYSSHNAIKTPALSIKPSLKSTNLSPLAGKQLTGRRWAAKLSSAKLASAQLPSCPQLVEPNIEDPWLTLSDLFGEEVATGETATDSQLKQSKSRTISSRTKKTNLALPANQAGEFSLQNLVNICQKFWTRLKPESGIVKHQKIAGKLIGTISKQASPVFKSPQQVKAGEISTQTGSQSTQVEPAPDWIETNATMMGYVKHPLEQLLIWLDQAMLWLEEVSLKAWRWLRYLKNGG
jgi:hypothetical protein